MFLQHTPDRRWPTTGTARDELQETSSSRGQAHLVTTRVHMGETSLADLLVDVELADGSVAAGLDPLRRSGRRTFRHGSLSELAITGSWLGTARRLGYAKDVGGRLDRHVYAGGERLGVVRVVTE